MEFRSNFNIKGMPIILPGKTRGVGTRIHIGGSHTLIKKNIPALKGVLTYEALVSISQIVTHLLAHAQPRVPLDTGDLRRSGYATVVTGRSWVGKVATGNADGTITAYPNKIKPSAVKSGRINLISGGVYYHRENEENEDIALWTHESLAPASERPPIPVAGDMTKYAKEIGTGPKYLEIPFLEYKNMYNNIIRDAFKHKLVKDLSQITRVTKQHKDTYTIDEVELTLDKIQTRGYYNKS